MSFLTASLLYKLQLVSRVGEDTTFPIQAQVGTGRTEHGCNKYLILNVKSDENQLYVTDYDGEEVENSNSVVGRCTL